MNRLIDYNYIGIRGTNHEMEIGQELDTSYRWDHDLMRSSYETDDPEELGGVCATNVFPDEDEEYAWVWYRDRDERLELLEKRIEEAVEFHKNYYSYKYGYIIAAENTAVACPEEEREIILENAVVISRCY